MSRRVVCLETGMVYPSMAAAARFIGLTKGAIYHAVKDGRAAGGYHWFTEGETPDASHFKRPKGVAVRCMETGEVYPSISEAAQAKGIARRKLSDVVNGICDGYHWTRIE